VDDRSGSPTGEPRQRWRIVFARDAPTDRGRSDDQAGWAEALLAAGVPMAVTSGTTRPRFAIAAPVPVGVAAEGELAELFLTERLTRADLWRRLDGHLPPGHRLVDLHDVWIGDRSLSAQLAAADYRLSVRGADAAELGRPCDLLLAARTLERSRAKGEGRSVTYDLRPLILALRAGPADRPDPAEPTTTTEPLAAGSAGSATTLRVRLRHGPEGPSGRPDEVVRALAEALDRPLDVTAVVRERLLTADDLPAGRESPLQRV
jgi:radical SAM-linked protein